MTIAQAFAHAPRLDPSGTSWLPFPFWLNGAAMMAFGRDLGVARSVAIVTAIGGALLVHGALLRAGARPWVAFMGVAVAMSSPWSVWLGVATVPEALTAALMVASALAISAERDRALGGLALLAACLSRYEAWPVAAVFAIACVSETKGWAPRSLLGAALALAGPAAWMTWNAHAHGDPLHFFARVAAYRARVAGGITPTVWTLYPGAFTRAGPLTLSLAGCGLPGLVFDRDLRRRWRWPFAASLALVVFLIEGDLHNGAPTHHPERALIAAFWTAAGFGVDGVRSVVVRFVWARPAREAWLVGALTGVALAWGVVWPLRVADHPASSDEESRASQLARGEALRQRRVPHLTVTPCAYEHFALIAAFTAPESVTVMPATGARVTEACPFVEER